jgi:glycosyltransferase involved in cell wall biosynthesis
LQPKTENRSQDRPLRICLITYRGNPTCGGQGVYVKRISRILTELGHQVHVLSGPPYPVLEDGIPLHRLPSLDLYNPDALFRVPSLRELGSFINLLEWLGVSTGGFPEPFTFGLRARRFFWNCPVPFDILHDNQSLSYGLLGVRRMGFPMVATIHHPITYDLKAELQQAARWWKKLKIRRWYSFIGMQVRVARQLSHIITVSENSRKDTAESFRIPLERFRVVQNGIDTDLFRPHPEVKRETGRIIVTNSADSPVKGVRYLLEAVASIVRKRDIVLTVIGTPKKNGVIEGLVRDLNLAGNIEFAGRIEDHEFPLHYARSTLAVVSSIYEGFGFPAGEAMACGTPVISTTGGALPEVVGDAGVLVPPADSGAMEKAILELLDNPGRREELSRAGQERILRNFTWKHAAEKILAVYREAIHDHRGFYPH